MPTSKRNRWPAALHPIFAQVKNLKCWRGQAQSAHLVKLRYSKTAASTCGRAYLTGDDQGAIHLRVGFDVAKAVEVLVHEVCHIACYARHGDTDDNGHGKEFYTMLIAATRELLGDAGSLSRIRRRVRYNGIHTQYRLDHQLDDYYSRAIKDGTFGKVITDLQVALLPRLRRTTSVVCRGAVRFAIPNLISDEMDAGEITWKDFPELTKAYQKAARTASGVTVEGPIALVNEMLDLVMQAGGYEGGEDRVILRLANALYTLKREVQIRKD